MSSSSPSQQPHQPQQHELILERLQHIQQQLSHCELYTKVSQITKTRLQHLTRTFNSPQISTQNVRWKTQQISTFIDHTLLKPTATTTEIVNLCDEAKQYMFYAVCVNSHHTALVKQHIQGTAIKLAVVVGFPLGACLTEVKSVEAKIASELGADEIDMVINIGALVDNDLCDCIS